MISPILYIICHRLNHVSRISISCCTLLLLFSATNSLHGMQKNEIVLRIFPAKKISFMGTSLFRATLEGFDFNNNQVTLIPTLMNAMTKELISSDSIMTKLKTGALPGYPLIYHKKLNFLLPNTHLNLVRHDQGSKKPIPITLPKKMNKRLLKYLTKDTESNRDCFDFVKKNIKC